MNKKIVLTWPIDGQVINQRFGENGEWYREHGIDIAGHNGIDFDVIEEKNIVNIYAAHEGRVEFARDDIKTNYFDDKEGSKLGNAVTIISNHTYDYHGKTVHLRTVYGHLKYKEVYVKAGDTVEAGQRIAKGNNTGFSTGSHLHFGFCPIKMKNNGNYNRVESGNRHLGYIDPFIYFFNKPDEPKNKPQPKSENNGRIQKKEEEKQKEEVVGIQKKLIEKLKKLRDTLKALLTLRRK